MALPTISGLKQQTAALVSQAEILKSLPVNDPERTAFYSTVSQVNAVVAKQLNENMGVLAEYTTRSNRADAFPDRAEPWSATDDARSLSLDNDCSELYFMKHTLEELASPESYEARIYVEVRTIRQKSSIVELPIVTGTAGKLKILGAEAFGIPIESVTGIFFNSWPQKKFFDVNQKDNDALVAWYSSNGAPAYFICNKKQ